MLRKINESVFGDVLYSVFGFSRIKIKKICLVDSHVTLN